ncbi:hypothetical protein R1flu_023109 [Riccia fluitans]|uniref:Uncharacterized protein n=1 Tax=Riccia fluitans TaxID=41844 RepID=A0ABD1XR39_9MARC
MAKSKRKRADPTGPSMTSLTAKAVSAETPFSTPNSVPAPTAAESMAESTANVDKSQLPTVSSERSLRQYTASAQTAQNSGNQPGFLKVQYLAKVAEWAATTVPNLGAFFGQRMAAASEALAIPPPTSYALCQRCETVLQVGENCSVRVSKAPKKWRKSKSKGVDAGVKNAIVYHCHFCKFGNKTPGTAKGHVKTKLSLAAALTQMKKLGSSNPAQQTKGAGSSKAPTATHAQSKNLGSNKTSSAVSEARNAAEAAPATPVGKPRSVMVSSPMTPSSGAEATGGGKKRKRKGWSTLKEMATAQLELPTPSRLGFMSPLNPNKKR